MSQPDPSDAVLPRAVLFDLDGTLADTERDGHRVAFNHAFAEHGLDLHWEVEHYGELLRVVGGRHRIAAGLQECGMAGPESEELAAAVHRTKTRIFVEAVTSGRIGPRPGVPQLVEDLVRNRVRIAVATTGTRDWAEPLVERVLGAGTAEVAVYGDDVAALKPDPDAFLRALERLGVPAADAVAVEDSGPGLGAALAAGLVTVVVTNDYTRDHDLTGAALVQESFGGSSPLTARVLGELLASVRHAAGA